jgi:hypothetical protein
MLRDSQRHGQGAASKDRQAQIDELGALIKEGWKIYDDPVKIAARYQDRDLADAVPRQIMYFDIGILVGRIVELEQELRGNRD